MQKQTVHIYYERNGELTVWQGQGFARLAMHALDMLDRAEWAKHNIAFRPLYSRWPRADAQRSA